MTILTERATAVNSQSIFAAADPNLWGYEDAHDGSAFFPEWFTAKADQLAYAVAFAKIRYSQAVASFLGHKNFVEPKPVKLDWSAELLAGNVEPAWFEYEDDTGPIDVELITGDLPF